jgi:hypothetical protein
MRAAHEHVVPAIARDDVDERNFRFDYQTAIS